MIREMRDPTLSKDREEEIVRMLDEIGAREEKYKAWLRIKDGKIPMPAMDLPFFPIYNEILAVNTPTITVPIPSDARHLFCIGSGRCTGATYLEVLRGRFNGDSGNNYDIQYAGGINTTNFALQSKAGSFFSFGNFTGASATSGAIGTFFSFLPHIQSNNWKSIVFLGGNPFYDATQMIGALGVAFYRNTSPISSITIYPETSTMQADSVISILGLK